MKKTSEKLLLMYNAEVNMEVRVREGEKLVIEFENEKFKIHKNSDKETFYIQGFGDLDEKSFPIRKGGHKIIGCSNFDNERVDDILVCENITNTAMAYDMLNTVKDLHEASHSTYYYKLVPQDYKLYKWEP